MNRFVNGGLALILLYFALPNAYAEPWILIDTNTHILVVLDNGRVKARFDNIAMGRGGVARNSIRQRGDGKTPLGDFRVAWINTNSRFNLFFGLDYPNLKFASKGLSKGIIDDDTYANIQLASIGNIPPPQDTALGGYIGIHGIGKSDPTLHNSFNWTDGCIALTNEQIQRLARWVHLGTRVVIQ